MAEELPGMPAPAHRVTHKLTGSWSEYLDEDNLPRLGDLATFDIAGQFRVTVVAEREPGDEDASQFVITWKLEDGAFG